MNAFQSMMVLVLAGAAATAAAEVEVRTANNGNLVMEDVPEIPAAVVDGLNRYQNVRSAILSEWTEDGEGIYIATRFDGDLTNREGFAIVTFAWVTTAAFSTRCHHRRTRRHVDHRSRDPAGRSPDPVPAPR